MPFLNPRERAALRSICDTFIPSLPSASEIRRYSAEHTQLAERVEEALLVATDEAARTELKLLLNAFEVGPVNGLLGGSWAAFSALPLAEREKLLAQWATSGLEVRRKAFMALKRVILFMGYTNQPDGKHPIWREIGYGPLPPPSDEPRPIEPLAITDSRTLETDVLVVGSGAGGGVVAGELSAAGFDVIVVEKGGYQAERDFTGDELRSNQDLFEKQGALTTEDTSIMVLAGATLGGGTTVNWNASFRTPAHVLEEWARDYGLDFVISADYQASMDAVMARTNVNTAESHPNPNNRRFADGCAALGYHLDVIPRNVKGCEDCGFCNFGCPFGSKQGTLKTYLQDAYARGARIIVKAHVLRVLHEDGVATGAVVEATGPDNKVRLITIRARIVVVAAGAIHTPALLRRSGLTNPNIGANLRLHPTSVIFSLFDEPIRTWQGAPMTRISKQFADLDGRGYGVALEVAPAHPGLTAATMPWISASRHKELVAQMERLGNVIAITRDYYGGRVKLDKRGQPILDYRLHPYDRNHLLRGLLEALRIHHAAGAEEIYAPQNALLGWKRRSGDNFASFLHKVETAGLEPLNFPLFSAHQMASARMAADPKRGALDLTGQTWEVENLFVADGSVVPTATGVNPMMSIMAMAHYVAQRVKERAQVVVMA
ncbi:MAG: GMC family oxidoreductase N-terminal domain-containing protein [Anaerolineae bacterium]|nr:GMC family oxidoreductase N-terminal domain-containing protein [Anaerolineae bacterium]MDW8172660.1 GMC family oxidoreductase N-terminal domain-containing protein [Anaerolineae bacterium]